LSELRVSELKKAIRKKGFDPLIKELVKTVSGKEIETLTSKQRGIFMKKIRRCIGYETEDILTSALTVEEKAPCILQITYEALARSEFRLLSREELKERIQRIGKTELVERVNEVLQKFSASSVNKT